MRLDDRPADGQARAHSIGFGGEKCIEDMIDILGIEPDPGI